MQRKRDQRETVCPNPHLSGICVDNQDKIPGGNKVFGMLDKMPDLSVEQLIEQGKEQMIQALDKADACWAWPGGGRGR